MITWGRRNRSKFM